LPFSYIFNFNKAFIISMKKLILGKIVNILQILTDLFQNFIIVFIPKTKNIIADQVAIFPTY